MLTIHIVENLKNKYHHKLGVKVNDAVAYIIISSAFFLYKVYKVQSDVTMSSCIKKEKNIFIGVCIFSAKLFIHKKLKKYKPRSPPNDI